MLNKKNKKNKKNDDTLANEIRDHLIEIVENSFIDIGGGDLIFSPISALQDVINYCQEELDKYE
jgi:hypothetical protein